MCNIHSLVLTLRRNGLVPFSEKLRFMYSVSVYSLDTRMLQLVASPSLQKRQSSIQPAFIEYESPSVAVLTVLELAHGSKLFAADGIPLRFKRQGHSLRWRFSTCSTR